MKAAYIKMVVVEMKRRKYLKYMLEKEFTEPDSNLEENANDNILLYFTGAIFPSALSPLTPDLPSHLPSSSPHVVESFVPSFLSCNCILQDIIVLRTLLIHNFQFS